MQLLEVWIQVTENIIFILIKKKVKKKILHT
jgi:hypothetical protein